jgi:hypothetical protein
MTDGTYLQDCVRQLAALRQEMTGAAARVAAVDAVAWRSLAADRFRAVLGAEAARARRCAALLDEAAAALAGHARAVVAAGGLPGVAR